MLLFRRIRSNVLFLFALTGVLPAMILGFILTRQTFQSMHDGIRANHLGVSAQVDQVVSGRLLELQRQLERGVDSPGVQNFSPEGMEKQFSLFLSYHPVFFNVYLFDASGMLRHTQYQTSFDFAQKKVGHLTIEQLPAALGTTARNTLRTGIPAVSPIMRNHFGEASMTVCCPVYDFTGTGKIVGVVSAAVKIEDAYFLRILDSLPLPSKSYVLITDTAGKVLTHRGEGIPATLDRYNWPAGGVYLGRGVPTYTGLVNVSGRRDFITSSPLPQLDARLIVGQPYETAFAPMGRLFRTVFWMIIMTLVLAAVFAYLAADILIRPVQSLVDGMNRIREGIYNHRIPNARDDEFGDSIRAFNGLAEQLQRNRLIETLWRSKWE